MNFSSLMPTLVASLLVTFGALIADRSLAWVNLPRRWTWLAAMSASVFIPFMGPWLPNFGLGLTVRNALQAVDATAAGYALSIDVVPLGPHWTLAAGWTALSILTLGVILESYRRVLRKVEEGANTVIDGRAVILCPTAGPLVLGLINPKLVVPHWILQLPRDERDLIIEHELQHVRSRDGLALAFGSLLLVAMPWNLLLWIQHSRLRLSIELDCDRRVLQKGFTRASYGQALLRTAGGMRGQSWFVPAWGESSSHLRARIFSMTQPSAPYGKFFAVPGGLMAALLLLAACDVGTPDSPPELASGPQMQAGSAQAPPVVSDTVEKGIAVDQSASAAPGSAQAPGDLIHYELEAEGGKTVLRQWTEVSSSANDSIDASAGVLERRVAEGQVRFLPAPTVRIPSSAAETDAAAAALERAIAEDLNAGVRPAPPRPLFRRNAPEDDAAAALERAIAEDQSRVRPAPPRPPAP